MPAIPEMALKIEANSGPPIIGKQISSLAEPTECAYFGVP